jgi:hypothetical protein
MNTANRTLVAVVHPNILSFTPQPERRTMAVGQYQLVIRGDGSKMRYLLLNTATGHVHIASPQDSDPEWEPHITKSPPVKPVKLNVGDEST